jgi:PAS domain S-box-containing protein
VTVEPEKAGGTGGADTPEAAAAEVLERLFEAAPLGLALLDPKLYVLRANAEFCRILGCDAASLAGRPVVAASPDVCGPEFSAAIRGVLGGGEPLKGIALVCGEERDQRHLQLACYPVRVGARLAGVGIVIEDVTQRRQREELHQRLLAMASHDLKTPLTAIGLSAQTLLRAVTERRHQGLVRGILASVGRVEGIVRDLVEYAVLERGGMPIRREPARIDEVCRAVVEECRAAAPSGQIVWQGEGDPRGEWDAARLAQAISNLVSNALQYGKRGAPVEVSWDARGDDVSVRVRNAGTPIAAETLPTIFEAFRRGPGEQRAKGLGLGLYIARKIATGHGGELGVTSDEGGTAFTLTVPRGLAARGLSSGVPPALRPEPTMPFELSREIAPGVVQLDGGYVRPRLVACYVVRGERAAVVETGSATSVPRILAALEESRVRREDVAYVVVTHVHLDHAGGAGALLAALPNAKLVVHPRGARHLVDPSKLVAGTMAVYGEERFRKLYGDLVPVPAGRVVEAQDGLELDLGGGRVLRCLDAPGHAKHHLVVFDEATRGFFTGDAFGLSYRETDLGGGPFLFPTTTPVQFDPPALHATIDRMLAARPERMYLTHYGLLEGDIPRHAAALHHAIDEHVRVARAAPPGPGRHAAIVEGLGELLMARLAAHGAEVARDEALAIFEGDLELNAQGLEVWLDGQAGA